MVNRGPHDVRVTVRRDDSQSDRALEPPRASCAACRRRRCRRRVAATRAFAQADDPLQQLIQQNQRGDLGQGFDSASRTIQMPKASLPTLSPATVQHTEQAIARYEQIVGERRLAEGAGDRPAARSARAIRPWRRCASG